MGAAAPGHAAQQTKRTDTTQAGRQGGRATGSPGEREGRQALPKCADIAARPRGTRMEGVPKPPNAGSAEALPPAPCRPACLPLLASLPNTTPGRGCSHGCPIRRATKRPENFTIPRRHRVNLKYKILLIKKSFASKIIKKGGGEPPLTEKTP